MLRQLLNGAEVMKMVRLTLPLSDMPRLSSPRPRLRHCKQLVLLSHPNLTLNLCSLFFVLSLALLPPPITFQLFLSQGVGFGLRRLPEIPLFCFPATGYLSELPRSTCPEESHSSFLFSFSCAEFLAAATNLSSFTATGPDKVAYPLLNHILCSGMDCLLHIFNLSWSSHSFPSIWKTFSIIPIYKMGKPLDSLAFFPNLAHLLRIKTF